MTENRKQAIINELQGIYNSLEPSGALSELDMFTLISTYNQAGNNAEMVGGSWVRENAPEPLKSLP